MISHSRLVPYTRPLMAGLAGHSPTYKTAARQTHRFHRKMAYAPVDAAAISPSEYGYPYRQWSSGILLKFIP